MLDISNVVIALNNLGNNINKTLIKECAKRLKCDKTDIISVDIKRRSIDARNKNKVSFIYTLQVEVKDEEALLAKNPKNVRISKDDRQDFAVVQDTTLDTEIVVVGAGCAGLFCALELAHAGLKPILIERGEPAYTRQDTINAFNAGTPLNCESNIQFGVGGAGTFSDGKLNTGTKSKAHRLILETFVRCGASPEILYDAKPHIGSDVLPKVVTNICNEIEGLGGTVKTSCKLVDLVIENNKVVAIKTSTYCPDSSSYKEETINTNCVVLATGHSARDTYEMLYEHNVALERKTFAMGVRIEHLQKDINKAQYGKKFAEHPALGAAPYKLVNHLRDGRSSFSFCMCPGGYVVAATSEEGQVVTNGMSLSDRAGTNANSGLLVNVFPEDLEGDSPLAGITLQRKYERKAYEVGEGNYQAPTQLVGDFLQNTPSSTMGRVTPTYPRGCKWTSIDSCLPEYITETLRASIPAMDRKLKGFAASDAVLTAIESRSSSPVRITRDDNLMSLGLNGLWPAGEGAGYAGGIMSAATDGLRVADAVIAHYKQ